MKIILFFLLLISFQVIALEKNILTDEYKELKYEAISILWKKYDECAHKDSYKIYENAYTECMTESEGKNNKERCEHIAEFATAKSLDEIPNTNHCKNLKPNNHRIYEMADKLAKERGVDKYISK